MKDFEDRKGATAATAKIVKSVLEKNPEAWMSTGEILRSTAIARGTKGVARFNKISQALRLLATQGLVIEGWLGAPVEGRQTPGTRVFYSMRGSKTELAKKNPRLAEAAVNKLTKGRA